MLVKVLSTVGKTFDGSSILNLKLVGLDFSPHIVRGKEFPEEHNREIQRQVFRKQIELAVEANLPLNVHSR